MTWVSSLGNTLGGAVSASSTPRATATTFGNPFATANVAAAVPVAPSQIGSKEDKHSMMAAFSDMGLALDASSAPTATVSSAKALLAKKESERQLEQQAEAEHAARRHARQSAKDRREAATPASALMQAIDAFAGEVSQSDAFSSALSSRKTSATGTASGGHARRTRQKQEKARGGKSVRELKRHQRRENYRHVY